jgi:hypothetical protein
MHPARLALRRPDGMSGRRSLSDLPERGDYRDSEAIGRETDPGSGWLGSPWEHLASDGVSEIRTNETLFLIAGQIRELHPFRLDSKYAVDWSGPIPGHLVVRSGCVQAGYPSFLVDFAVEFPHHPKQAFSQSREPIELHLSEGVLLVHQTIPA